ncbi:MAG: 50S ribosomal protein L25 [Candidatus Krumholzibacteria bacterium]|nr:50S ribosomal protein L25 [Candidatus Krumholzibacteria bacterium]MDP6669897.1 50S ribosomal protein L25 [Candidatus Krumholzibacteria bacterium]MDP7021668.1 50S ribosomal protein L25 [Candidatus Krumholzibacteria bacterium]
MKTVSLKAQSRQGKGKSVTRKLRASGQIPGNLYGAGVPSESIQLNNTELETMFRLHKGGNFLIELEIDDNEAILTLIREHQIHPVSRKHVHLDFQRVQLGQKLNVDIPIYLTGEAIGAKDFGGTVEQVLRSVSVSCLPREIPDFIEIDINELGINDSIHVGSLDVPNVEFLVDESQTVVLCAPPRLSTEAEDEEPEEGLEGEEAAEGEGEETAEGSSKEDAE